MESGNGTRRVAIFGGGISGLTVAHECAEAGLAVTVYEKAERFGGKAIGYHLPEGHAFAGVPVEHAIRTYQSTYFSLYETMKRVPFTDARGAQRTVFDNVKPAPGLFMTAGTTKPDYLDHLPADMVVQTSTKISAGDRIRSLFACMRAWGVPPHEIAAFVLMNLQYGMAGESRKRRWGRTLTFEQFAKFDRRSAAYRGFVYGIAELATAVKPWASSMVAMDLLYRFVMGGRINAHNMASTVNILNGPTSDRFIDPWVAELRRMGVTLHAGTALGTLDTLSGRVNGAALADGTRVEADAYVVAMPAKFVTDLLPAAQQHPSLHQVGNAWSNGFQIFLPRVTPSMQNSLTFALPVSSPWKIIYMVQAAPLWDDVAMAKGVGAVISACVTNMEQPGILYGKALVHCTWDEVQAEIIAQIDLKETGEVMGAYLDPFLRYVSEEEYRRDDTYRLWDAGPLNPDGHRWVNASWHCILLPKYYDHPIAPATGVAGLYLAGEYIDTAIHLPNMEKASQAGKLCAATVLHGLGLPFDAGRLTAPVYPFRGIRDLDEALFGGPKTAAKGPVFRAG